MKLRLGAYLTGIFFLCVLVFPYFTSYHNPRASHIDMAQGQYQASHDKKIKKYLQCMGFLSLTQMLISRPSFQPIRNTIHSSTTSCCCSQHSCRASPA